MLEVDVAELTPDRLLLPPVVTNMRAAALAGTGRYRDHRDAWTGEAVGPAGGGGIRSAITDMARLAAALLDGTAPGPAAIEPTADFMRGARGGAAWITLDVKRPDVAVKSPSTTAARAASAASWASTAQRNPASSCSPRRSEA